jgi:hypothetical protein
LRARFFEGFPSDFAPQPATPAGFLLRLAGPSRKDTPMPERPFTSEAEIRRIGHGLIDLSLPKAEWTHGAHFAAALWLMRYRSGRNLSQLMPELIRAYNEATGVANTPTGGYHETITQASLRAARALFARHSSSVPVFEIANALMASPLGRSDWPLEYWSKPVLFSTGARLAWRDPDLKPLPFE